MLTAAQSHFVLGAAFGACIGIIVGWIGRAWQERHPM